MVELPQVIASPVSVKADNTWKWLALSFAAAWLLTLLYLVVNRFKARPEMEKPNNEGLPLKAVIKQLEAACKVNDAASAKLALTQWIGLQHPGLSLESVQELCGQELQLEIQQLNQHLYSKQAESWKGSRLAQLVREHSRNITDKAAKDAALEPLHRL